MIVGLSGPAGCGKTTHADALMDYAERHLGYNSLRLPFAGPLKRIAMSMGWNGKKDEKGRRLLQILGTECGRECIGPNVWVDLWHQEAIKKGVCTLVVADDVRFDNEVEAVRALGGTVVKLQGEGYDMGQEANQHASERVPEASDIIWHSSNTRDPYELAQYLLGDMRK